MNKLQWFSFIIFVVGTLVFVMQTQTRYEEAISAYEVPAAAVMARVQHEKEPKLKTEVTDTLCPRSMYYSTAVRVLNDYLDKHEKEVRNFGVPPDGHIYRPIGPMSTEDYLELRKRLESSCVIDSVYPGAMSRMRYEIVASRFDALEAKINSLEAMLERAHVVARADSIQVENWRFVGFSIGFPEHFTPTDSLFLGLIWHHFTRYEISFELVDSLEGK